MQFKRKDYKNINAYVGFSADSSTLIILDQMGNYFEQEIAKGEYKSEKAKNHKSIM